MAKKKAPSGLSISREGSRFTFTWKLGSKNYLAQKFQYRLYSNNKWGPWIVKGNTGNNNDTVRPKSTSLSFTIDLNQNFTKLEFQVKGQTGKKNGKAIYTAWSKPGTWEIKAPGNMKVEAALQSEFETTFNWEYTSDVDDTSKTIYAGFEWESVLAKDYNSSDGEAAFNSNPIQSGNGTGVNGDWTKEEVGWSDPEFSYTRWIRVRAKGPAGTSKWRYAHHTYARSKRTSNVTASLTPKAGGGFTVSANWTTAAGFSTPVDKTTVEYMITEPASTVETVNNVRVTTLSCPNSGSWTSINALGGLDGNRSIAFPLGEDLPENKVIFVRVNTVHDADSSTVHGEPQLVEGGLGNLAKPTGLTITETDPSARRFTVRATNNSNIAASFLAVYFRTTSNTSADNIIGVISPGETSVTCQLPEWPEGDSISLGVRAFVADYSPATPVSGVGNYAITNERMRSELVWDGGAVPLPPSDIVVSKLNSTTVQVSWKWAWAEATSAELSWSDHKDAWESTNAPSTFTVTNVHASRWNITDLSVGTWYIRIRLLKTTGDTETYGTYSDIYEIKLSESPAIPYLTVSDSVAPVDGSITCYWSYVSNDGTGQIQADVAEAFIDGDVVSYSEPIKSTNATQHLTLNGDDFETLGWTAGSTHYLVVRVMSASKETSVGWSNTVPVTIADEIETTITQTSLVNGELTTLPLTATATGAGEGGTTRYILERADNYHLDRPDETDYDGYEGETIAIADTQGESQVIFDRDDLIGLLDDGAPYRLIAESIDSYGQTASKSVEFRVHWDHQAVEPSATVVIDHENGAAIITPIMPESGYAEGDTCDIYRLSADRPVLIYSGANFGTAYVDPYPTIGFFGGYRIVYKTVYGDYIDVENYPAWTDYSAVDDPQYMYSKFGIIIDFDGEQLILPFDVTVSNSWEKDFTETRYLGGSIKGDWNPGVSKSASLSTNIPVAYSPDNIILVRRLADYPGICHVRTPEGSSYTANVTVKEDREERKVNMISKVSLDIVRVESEGFDGMTYEDWIAEDE